MATALTFPEVDRAPIENSTKSIPISATVEQRPVRAAAVLSATVQAPVKASLVLNAPAADQAGSGREVISRRTLKVGDTVHYGDLVAEVSGRPILAMPTSMPLYRDMGVGMSGSDIEALQKLLGKLGYFTSAVNGKFGSGTLDALNRLFEAADYDTPTLASNKRGLPLADTTTLPRDGVRVTKAAPVGAVLGGSPPVTGDGGKANDPGSGTQSLAQVEVSPAAVTARVDVLQAQTIKRGSRVTVRVGASAPASSTVRSVSEFREAESSQPAGYDITVSLPKKLADMAKANEAATITESADDIPKGPAVPLVSIRQDAQGTYVVLAGPDGTGADTKRVRVTVRGQSQGYAILEDTPDLPEGSAVLVSGAV